MWICDLASQIRDIIANSIPRQLLLIDYLPQAAAPRYFTNDDRVSGYIETKNHQDVVTAIKTEEIYVPLLQTSASDRLVDESYVVPIQSNICPAYTEIKVEHKGIKQTVSRIAELFTNREMDILLKLFNATGQKDSIDKQFGSTSFLNSGFRMIEQYDALVQHVLFNPCDFDEHKDEWKTCLDECKDGCHLWTSNILVHSKVPKGQVIFCGDKDTIGAIPIRTDIVVSELHGYNPDYFVCYQEAGYCVLNGDMVCICQEKTNA